MSDFFEYRNDPELASPATKAPREVCCVKVMALKACADYVRKMSVTGDREAAKLVNLLERASIGPDWEPNAVGTESARLFSSLVEQPNA